MGVGIVRRDREKTRILLVMASALDSKGNPIKQRRLYLPGLTFPMLAAVTPPDCELRLLNESVETVPYDEPWDLVGVTGMGSGIMRGWMIADEFRRRGATVVIGGIAASLLGPERSLEHADSVVVGEAEEIWPEVVRDFQGGRLKPVYRMEKPPPIDELPEPRYDLLNRSKVGLWRPVQATRGCPFTCDFCSVTSFFGGGYRKRPPEHVVRDVRAAKRFGTRYIDFIDDNIGVDWNYCTRLWEALIPEKIIWMSQCSLHISERPDMLELAHRSGCRLLSFGIETTSPESLEIHDKKWNRPERYREAVKIIRQHGIDVSTEMIVGLDGDDLSVFDRTYEFLVENKISVPRIHILTPIPGTTLYESMLLQNRMVSDDFRRFTGSQVVFKPRNIDPEELETGYWKLYERLFSWSTILRRFTHNQASLNPFMRAFLLGVNLHYKNHIRQRITPGTI